MAAPGASWWTRLITFSSGFIEIDQTARHLEAAIAQAQELLLDVGADELGVKLRKRAVVDVAGLDADRKVAIAKLSAKSGAATRPLISQ
jgi:hypothetical protein